MIHRLRNYRLLAVVGSLGAAFGLAGPPQDVRPEERLNTPQLRETILEALAYLEDNQVRSRPGKRSCRNDSSEDPEGCHGRLSVNLGSIEDINIPSHPTKNRSGEWTAHIHLLPNRLGWQQRTFVGTPDSNLFVTAEVAYRLAAFDDTTLPRDRAFLSGMVSHALVNIARYKRGDAYNFWPQLPGSDGPYPRTGPLNIGMPLLRFQTRTYLRAPNLLGLVTQGQRLPARDWLAAALDRRLNPAGADALMNIPNDADDTALAVAVQTVHGRLSGGSPPDVNALWQVTRFRDLNRRHEDGRDAWRGQETGAYLTWLKDEEEPVFANPSSGVIPLAVNNVDAVVNANVIHALALTGNKHWPGYCEGLHLVARAAHLKDWPRASIYYPHYLMFPYVASRAYRAGAQEGPMPAAMHLLLRRMLDAQEEYGRKHPRSRGAFPGGTDPSDHFSTALGLTTLLNLGRPVTCDADLTRRYERAIQTAAAYLIRTRRQCRFSEATTVTALGGSVSRAAVWDTGLFFAARDLAHWRSQAITVASVAEALAKYAVEYDRRDASPDQRRLALMPRSASDPRIELVVVHVGVNAPR